MSDDERAIRDLIDEWHRASAAGDVKTLLGMMDEDVIFLTPGNPPMRGRDAFAASFQPFIADRRIESTSEIQEIQVTGDWAYFWSHLRVSVTPGPEGSPLRRSGYTLTVLRKRPNGGWVLFRDANLLAAEP
jgi:uncharacterized protein (TIGR02246 family)